jgi:hypothetical protein
MNASPRVIWALALGLAAGLLSALPYGRATEAVAQDAAPATKPEFKTLSFDEAMQGQLVRSMPLKLTFPADYEMLVLDPAINGVVWARRADLDHIAQTKETPPDAGLFHGRLTTQIGYDRASNSFICLGCSEKDVKAELEAAGANDVKVQKHVINGIPMLLLDTGTANMRGAVRNKLYMAYVAVLIDTNVMLISYSPPLDSKDEGQTAWQAFTRALTQGVVSAEPPASKPSSFADDLAQATRSATFRPVADAFIAALVAGDAAKGMNMISPNLIKAVGRDTVQGALRDQTLPFFATFKEFGRSQTIARTGDEFGNEGFVFYLTMVPAQGNARPFAVYVVEENGAKVIANLLLDHDRSKATAR